MKTLGLRSIGAFVPPHKLTNHDLEAMVETTDEWIVQRTGIRERRLAKDLKTSDMAVAAAQACLAGTEVTPDLVIVNSGTAERIYPSQSSIVANRLGLKTSVIFDLNAACSGFVYGLALAESLMQTKGYQNTLIVAGEKMSTFTNYTDRRSCILFGDGAAAVLLTTEGWEHELLATELGSDPSGSDLVTMGARDGDPYFWQDGTKVFKFAVQTLVRMIGRLKEKVGLRDTDAFYVIPHQANLRIVQAVADNLALPMERFVLNIERYGNTSSASIGLALEESWREGRFKKGDTLFLIGFGGGLSWAGAALRW